jgi:hypothetical protein
MTSAACYYSSEKWGQSGRARMTGFFSPSHFSVNLSHFFQLVLAKWKVLPIIGRALRETARLVRETDPFFIRFASSYKPLVCELADAEV